MKEALYYQKEENGIKCLLCPHHCLIKSNKKGICKTRVADNEKLYTLAYANPCSISIDPVEKKPLYHFQPGSRTFSIATAGCNLSCLNCQNSSISQIGPDEITNYNLFPSELIKHSLQNKCKSISYTYTEPIVYYEYTIESAKLAKQNRIKNIIVSAGYINEKPLKELCNYIDAANIDLKSFDNEIYKRLNKATLEPVLNTLKTLLKQNVWLEITNLIIPRWTDDLIMIRNMCKWLFDNGFENVPIHFSRFYPQHKLNQVQPTPISTLEEVYVIAKESGLKYIYLGNVMGNKYENTYCPHCSKILIKRNGYNITENNIVEGKCNLCKNSIPGVWN